MDQENKPDNKPEENDHTGNIPPPDKTGNPEGQFLAGDKNSEENASQEHQREESTSGENISANNQPDESAPDESGTGNKEEDELHFQKLYKSRKNKIIFGVCSGLGKYFNIDPVIFRLLFILSLLIGGWGLLIYFIAGIIVPYDPEEAPEVNVRTDEEEYDHTKENTRMIIGSSLILLGLFALLRSTGLIRYFSFFGLTNEIIMPVILIALGIFLIYRNNFRSPERTSMDYREEEDVHYPRRLHLSVSNKKIAGVCGGLGEYFAIDPNLIRVLWLIFTFSSFGIGILIYVLFAIIVPKEKTV